MLCAYHERMAHNFLKEVGPKKLWAQTSAVPLKKSSMGMLKVHKTIFRWSFYYYNMTKAQNKHYKPTLTLSSL